jgi:hypothetical protein
MHSHVAHLHYCSHCSVRSPYHAQQMPCSTADAHCHASQNQPLCHEHSNKGHESSCCRCCHPQAGHWARLWEQHWISAGSLSELSCGRTYCQCSRVSNGFVWDPGGVLNTNMHVDLVSHNACHQSLACAGPFFQPNAFKQRSGLAGARKCYRLA